VIYVLLIVIRDRSVALKIKISSQ